MSFYNARLAESILQPYQPRHQSHSKFLSVRGLRYHVRSWDPDPARPCDGTLVLLHGWMDVSASFQFVVDSFVRNWRVYAPDWRGYGLTEGPQVDCYWFADYLADLDRLLDALVADEPADLVGHSMGGNIATLYAGVRPARVRRLVNLEGFGLAGNSPDEAPARYARWLDELRSPQGMRDYASREEVAQRLMGNNPRLTAQRAAFIAQHWARERADGRFEVLGDPAHKVVNPTLYRAEEATACWREVRAEVLLVTADVRDQWHAFVDSDAYRARLLALRSLQRARVDGAGHMLHHDRPEEVARLIEDFVR